MTECRCNNTPINILVSYAYCGNDKSFTERVINMSRSGVANFMLDSGAFTKFNAKSAFKHVNLQDYVTYCHQYGEEFEKYVMLDVVGNEEQSKKNYEYMVRSGLSPMFVVTMFDKDMNYVRQTLNTNANICVAGGVTTKSDWMTKRFQDIYKACEGKCKIHGLGYVTFPKMLQLNLASVDSSSWNAAPARFGNIVYFDNGLKQSLYKEFMSGKKRMPKQVVNALEFCGITPSMFKREENNRGKASIGLMLSLLANTQLQRYCYRRGLRFFLAAGKLLDLIQIQYIVENINNLRYEDFQKL